MGIQRVTATEDVSNVVLAEKLNEVIDALNSVITEVRNIANDLADSKTELGRSFLSLSSTEQSKMPVENQPDDKELEKEFIEAFEQPVEDDNN